MHQHNQLELFCGPHPTKELANLHLFCSMKHVMAIGRRRTRMGHAYHSATRKKHVERRMPIDKQRDYAVEGQD